MSGVAIACNSNDVGLGYADCRKSFLEKIDSGDVRSINGLAIAPEYSAYFTADWASGEEGRRAQIYLSRCVDGIWSDPRVIMASPYSDYQPTLSPDGRRLYFTSTRPLYGGAEGVRQNVWMAVERYGAWRASPIADLASSAWDGHAIEIGADRMMFASDRPGGAGMVDLYETYETNGARTLEAVASLNSAASDNDMAFFDAENVLVFARYDPQSEDIDLFASAQIDREWSAPVALRMINTSEWEASPAFSPDGADFFFKRGDGPFIRTTVDVVVDAARSSVLVRDSDEPSRSLEAGQGRSS